MKDRIKRIKVFAKSGQSIFCIAVEYRCLACFPSDLPQTLPDYAALTHRREEIRNEYQAEFDMQKRIVQEEIELQRELVMDIDENIMEEGDDEGW